MKANDNVLNRYDGRTGTVTRIYWVDVYPDMDYSPRRKAAEIMYTDRDRQLTSCGTLSELKQDGWILR